MGSFWWSSKERDPAHPAEGVARARRARTIRTICGVRVSTSRGELDISRIRTRGSGKWLSLLSADSFVFRLPEHIKSRLDKFSSETSPLIDKLSIEADLSDVIVRGLSESKLLDQESREDVLAIAIDEPEAFAIDFDGKRQYFSLVCPQTIAEKTGLNVISNLHLADVLAGGGGEPLDALPLWLMFADRSETISTSWTLVFDGREEVRLFSLPPSDGLDAEQPAIQFKSFPQLTSLLPTGPKLDGLAKLSGDAWGHLAATGTIRAEIITFIASFLRSTEHDSKSYVRWSHEEISKFALPDIFASYFELMAKSVLEFSFGDESDARKDQEVVLLGRCFGNGYLANRLSHNGWQLAPAPLASSLGGRHTGGVIAAMLGFLHIDQLPASICLLTDADVPRIHGQLTPGHPAQWRKLVLEMADYHPPAMKLRDAV